MISYLSPPSSECVGGKLGARRVELLFLLIRICLHYSGISDHWAKTWSPLHRQTSLGFFFLSLFPSSLQLDFFISPPKSFIPIFIVLICNVNFLFNLFIVFLQYFIFKVNILKGPQLLFLEMLLFCSWKLTQWQRIVFPKCLNIYLLAYSTNVWVITKSFFSLVILSMLQNEVFHVSGVSHNRLCNPFTWLCIVGSR